MDQTRPNFYFTQARNMPCVNDALHDLWHPICNSFQEHAMCHWNSMWPAASHMLPRNMPCVYSMCPAVSYMYCYPGMCHVSLILTVPNSLPYVMLPRNMPCVTDTQRGLQRPICNVTHRNMACVTETQCGLRRPIYYPGICHASIQCALSTPYVNM